MRVPGGAGAGGGPSPDPLSPPASAEAEDPGLHPRADADALRVGPGGTAAGPGGKSGSGHPRPCTRLRKTPESKLCRVRAPRLPGPCGAGLARRGGAGARVLRRPHSWQSLAGTSGQHVSPITLPKACARLFLSTGWRGEGVSFGRQPPPPPHAGEMAGWRGPGGFGDLPAGWIPESSCAPGEGPGRPALEPRPLPVGLTALSEGLTGIQ